MPPKAEQSIFSIMPSQAKVFTFKIELGDFSAVLLLAADQTLYELAAAILEAVDFEMDHSFGFYSAPDLSRSSSKKQSYTLFADIGDEDDPGVKKTAIASVFRAKKKMYFLFDYGDE